MTDTAAPTSLLARFRGPLACRRTANALTVSGAAVDCAEEVLIVTFISPVVPGLPDSLGVAALSALDEHHYRISCASRDWVIEAASLHVHRDIAAAFHRAIPPRPVPLAKRFLWRLVMALAGNRAGRRLFVSLRGKWGG
ncbi:MAG: hypothetical protein ACRETZ_11780 [Steroidobacteraceae bacterium]